jgi:hypothetical protein
MPLAFTLGNLMSTLKVLDGKRTKPSSTADTSAIGELPCRTMLGACVTEWPANEREHLAHAPVYPTKAKPTGAFKNNRRRVATQMHSSGSSAVHEGANATNDNYERHYGR